jgi:hypothetical protein
MHRTPSLRSAAMLARAGTSEGLNSWFVPCRARNAIGTGVSGDVGEGCSRTRIGADGFPHGVLRDRAATGEKPGRDSRPVPPMTAMEMGSEGGRR